MWIVTLSYKVPLADVDVHLEGHRDWLRGAVGRGIVVAAGRKNPRTGGVLLSFAPRTELESALAEDPFATEGLADYEIVEVDVTTTAPGFEVLRG